MTVTGEQLAIAVLRVEQDRLHPERVDDDQEYIEKADDHLDDIIASAAPEETRTALRLLAQQLVVAFSIIEEETLGVFNGERCVRSLGLEMAMAEYSS